MEETMNSKDTKKTPGKIHPNQKPAADLLMSRNPPSPSGVGDYGKRSNIRPTGQQHLDPAVNLLDESKAKMRREASEQLAAGPARKNRKNMLNHRRNIKVAGRNFDEKPIDDLGRYVEGELDFYKDDWEENRAAYTPAQSGSPGAAPNQDVINPPPLERP